MSKLSTFLPASILFLVAMLVFVPLLPAQYLYDDLVVIVSNSLLRDIHTFADCFSFTYKASRPIADFFLAFGALIGKGQPYGQRILSLLIHGINSILIFIILKNLIGVSKAPRFFPFLITLLFSIHPIHSETLAVAQYRMELLGSFFTLSAIFISLKLKSAQASSLKNRALWFFLFISLGGATLSKEVFLITAPLAVWLCLSISGSSPIFLARLVCIQLFWGLILFSLLISDGDSAQPYQELLGYNHLSPSQHLQLSARALATGVKQILTGQGFTFTRLLDRQSGFYHLPLSVSGLLILGFIGIGFSLFRMRGFYRASLGFFFVFIFLYFFIPNINIGSEHYWYLSTLGILAFSVYSLFQILSRFTSRPQFLFSLVISILSICYFSATERRLVQMQTRISLYQAELKSHPESISSWINLAASLLESPDDSLALSAKPYLDQARKMDPDNTVLINNEFMYSVKMKDFKSAEIQLKRIRSLFLSQPQKLSTFYLYLLDAALTSHECELAHNTKREFDILNPASSDGFEVTKALKETCNS